MILAGIDIGRSGIKIMVRSNGRNEQLDVIPPYATLAVNLNDPDEARLALRDTVELDDGRWFFGETALIQMEQAKPGVYASWSETPEYEALIAGALLRLRQRGFDTNNMAIVGGLPSESSSEQRERVADLFRKHAGPNARAKVIPQPVGPFFLTQYLNPTLEIGKNATVIIDVGRYSTDFAMMLNGRPVSSMFVSAPGVRNAVEHFSELMRPKLRSQPSYERLEQAIRTGKMNINAKPVDCAAEVTDARARFSKTILTELNKYLARREGGVDYIILAGGGAPMVAADLATVIDFLRAPNDRFAVAHGSMLAANSL